MGRGLGGGPLGSERDERGEMEGAVEDETEEILPELLSLVCGGPPSLSGLRSDSSPDLKSPDTDNGLDLVSVVADGSDLLSGLGGSSCELAEALEEEVSVTQELSESPSLLVCGCLTCCLLGLGRV